MSGPNSLTAIKKKVKAYRKNMCRSELMPTPCKFRARYGLRGDIPIYCCYHYNREIDVYQEDSNCQFPDCKEKKQIGGKFCLEHLSDLLPKWYIEKIEKAKRKFIRRKFDSQLTLGPKFNLSPQPSRSESIVFYNTITVDPSVIVNIGIHSNDELLDEVQARLRNDSAFVEKFENLFWQSLNSQI